MSKVFYDKPLFYTILEIYDKYADNYADNVSEEYILGLIKKLADDTDIRAKYNEKDIIDYITFHNHTNVLREVLKKFDTIKNDQEKINEHIICIIMFGNNVDMIDILINYCNNFDINAVDVTNYTLLDYAILSKNIPTVELLLDQDGIDINTPHGCGLSPLHLAVDCNSAHIVSLLLKKDDIKVNTLSKNRFNGTYGDAPLHIAVKRKLYDIINILLSHNDIDVNNTNYYGNTPLVTAIENRSVFIIEKLINHKNIDINKKSGNPPKSPFIVANEQNTRYRTEKTQQIVNILFEHNKN